MICCMQPGFFRCLSSKRALYCESKSRTLWKSFRFSFQTMTTLHFFMTEPIQRTTHLPSSSNSPLNNTQTSHLQNSAELINLTESNDVTTGDDDGNVDALNHLLGTATLMVSALTIFGNGSLMWIIIRTPKLRTITNGFIVSLAFSDLLVGLLVMPFCAGKVISALLICVRSRPASGCAWTCVTECTRSWWKAIVNVLSLRPNRSMFRKSDFPRAEDFMASRPPYTFIAKAAAITSMDFLMPLYHSVHFMVVRRPVSESHFSEMAGWHMFYGWVGIPHSPHGGHGLHSLQGPCSPNFVYQTKWPTVSLHCFLFSVAGVLFEDDWVFSSGFCEVTGFLGNLCNIAALLNLTMVSIDR